MVSFGNRGLGRVVLQGVEMNQRHRVDLERVVDDEFHPRKADAVKGKPPPAEGGGGVGEVQHDLGAGLGQIVQTQDFGGEFGDTFIDHTLVAACAGDGNLLFVMQDMGGIAGADDGRQAKLATDDGGMAGAAAVVGHDRRGAFHDRDPVRVGGAGHQDRAVDESVDLMRGSR